MTKLATINYGYGIARLWGDFTPETLEGEFYKFANQCFGIRKSISQCAILSIKDAEFPKIFGVKPDRIGTVLMHSGDEIVWNRKGKKIKSEFD